MIAPPLGGAGTRAGVPDLALDLRLVDRLELDGHNFLTGHSVPPVTALRGLFRLSYSHYITIIK